MQPRGTGVLLMVVIATGCTLDLSGLGSTAGAPTDASVLDGTSGPDANSDIDEGVDASEAGHDAGVDGSGSGDATMEASPPAESGTDAPEPPDGPCGSICDGACSGQPDCSACADAPLLCASTDVCVSDCSACSGSPIECYACDATGQNPLGSCQPADQGTYCLSGDYSQAYDGQSGTHCPCGESADCPGSTQVCIAIGSTQDFACYTCGEQLTQTSDCAGGGKCNAQQDECH